MTREQSAGDGAEKGERRERKARKRMPVHGRSLEAVINAIRKRAAKVTRRRQSGA